MSPNPEACEEELPFREGQLIKVRMPTLIDTLFFWDHKVPQFLHIFLIAFRLLERKMPMVFTGANVETAPATCLAIWYQRSKSTTSVWLETYSKTTIEIVA